MSEKKARRATLAAKFNALTISLVVLAALGVFLRQTTHERAAGEAALREHGVSLARVLAQTSEYGIYTQDEATLQPLVAGPFADASVAYVAVRAADHRPLSVKARSPSLEPPLPGARRGQAAVAGVSVSEVEVGGNPCLDILVPVRTQDAGLDGLGDAEGTGGAPETLGYVQLGLSLEPVRARFREGLKEALGFTGVLLAFGALLTVLLTRQITGPLRELRRAADGIAEGAGDLTQVFEARSGDEVGALAGSFNRFLSRLREMVSRVRGSATHLAGAIAAIDQASAGTRDGAQQQTRAVTESFAALNGIGQGITGIAANATQLLATAQQSAGAAAQMEVSGREVANRVEVLASVVEQVTNAIRELSSTAQQIMSSVEVLSGSTAATASAVAHANAAVKGIEESAAATHRLSQEATRDAERGREAVDETTRGMHAIQETVDGAGRVIEELGERCEEIGAILGVIDDVASQTGLLALNAAILAAQAGEHGRGFGVVASEIRELADRTAQSTGQITAIVENLQGTAREAVLTVRSGKERVRTEVTRAGTAVAALEQIGGSTSSALEQMRSIARATGEHARSSEEITGAVQQVAASVDTIAATIQQQTAGLQQLSRAAETMREVSAEVKDRAGEQARAAGLIRQAAEGVRASAESIDRATRNQEAGSREVLEAMARLQDLSQDETLRAEQLDQALKTLAEQIRLLEHEMQAFRV